MGPGGGLKKIGLEGVDSVKNVQTPRVEGIGKFSCESILGGGFQPILSRGVGVLVLAERKPPPHNCCRLEPHTSPLEFFFWNRPHMYQVRMHVPLARAALNHQRDLRSVKATCELVKNTMYCARTRRYANVVGLISVCLKILEKHYKLN